jgi:methionyl-tRNA synthetase
MNKYIEDTKPWTLWKEKKVSELEQFMYSLLEGIRCVAIYLYPFMPSTAQSIYFQLGLDFKTANLEQVEWGQVAGFQIKKEKPLFPRIDVD